MNTCLSKKDALSIAFCRSLLSFGHSSFKGVVTHMIHTQCIFFLFFCERVPIFVSSSKIVHVKATTMGSLPKRRKSRLLLSTSLLLSTAIDSVLGFVPLHSTTAINRSCETRTCIQTAPHLRNQLPSSQRTRLYSSSMDIQFSSTSFYLARIVFLRMLALVYGVAFWVARNQNKGLIGDNGITPCRYYLQQAKQRGKHKQKIRQEWLQDYPAQACFWNTNPIILKLRFWCWDCSDSLNRPVTTLLWLCKNPQCLNSWLDRIALVAIACSLPILMTGTANVPLLLILWVCQRSIMAVGGPWYGYGWEPQLAELGFHALLLVPLWDRHSNMAPPYLVIYAIRWYLFKIMMGAVSFNNKSHVFCVRYTQLSYFCLWRVWSS